MSGHAMIPGLNAATEAARAHAFEETPAPSVPRLRVRALAGAPVATPITWEELEKGRINPQSFNLKNLFRRLSEKGDPWKNISRSARSLKTALKKLESRQSS